MHELTKIPSTASQPRSWLLVKESSNNDTKNDGIEWIGDGQVIQDGALYISTPIDPLFLLIPHLLPASTENKKGYFLPIDDILESLITSAETGKLVSHWARLIRPGTISRRHIEARIRACSDSVDAGGEIAYRVNQDKVVKILAKKCEAMAVGGLPKSLEDEFVTKPLVRPNSEAAQGTKTVALEVRENSPKDHPKPGLKPSEPQCSEDTPSTTDGDTPNIHQLLRLRVSLQFLTSTYLAAHIATLLTSYLKTVHDFTSLDERLTELKRLRLETTAVRSGDFSLKRSVNDETIDDRAEKKRKKEEEEKKKKKAISKGVKELSKVNTRGMAKMTSFFKKKD